MLRWAIGAGLAVVGMVTTVLVGGDDPGRAPTPASAVAHVAPGATGDCSVADPCALERALGDGSTAQVVLLGSGRYPRAVIDRAVTIRPAVAAQPVLLAVNVRSAGARLLGVRVEGNVMVSREAAGATIRDSVIRGAMSVQADRARLIGNDIGGTTDKDPVQVTGSPTGVLLEGNRIHDGARGSAWGHVDCVQVTSGTDITISDNDLRQCSNSAVIVKPDLGPIRRVTIEGNQLAACWPRTATCQGGIALYVRRADHEINEVMIRDNDIVGASSFEQIAGLDVDGNVLQTLTRNPACPARTRGNTIRQRHRAACPLGEGDRYAR